MAQVTQPVEPDAPAMDNAHRLMESIGRDNLYAIIGRATGENPGLAKILATLDGSARLCADSESLGAALAAAKEMGCTHAIAFSADGTPGVDEPALLMAAATKNPAAMILGVRGMSQSAGVWRRMSDLLIRLETGLRLSDPRGPRVYPLRLVALIDPHRKRRLGDIECLVRAAWVGCPIIQVPLPAPPPGIVLRRSPWNMMRNGLHESAIHVRLLARALSGWPHPKYDPDVAGKSHPPFWRSIGQWFNPLRAWRDLRQGGLSRNEMAAGIAVGVFIANTPAWGFHTVLSVYTARRLHLHPLAVVTGSHISAPPMGPMLITAAMFLGHFLLHGSKPRWELVSPFNGHPFSNGISLLCDWLLGAVLIGTGLSIATFIVCNFLFRIFERRHPTDLPPAPGAAPAESANKVSCPPA